MTNQIVLKIILALLGVFVVFSGLDMTLGGFFTLGWMEQVTFFEVVDDAKFQEADNHYRFLGGVWTGMGVLLILSVTNLKKYQSMLTLVFACVFLGGLARLSQMNAEVLLSPGVLWAFVVEVVGMPLLYLWLSKSVVDGISSEV
ncbi:MAG: DUF4345 domain-containing protein [Pseudomonadales bacterium]|nr:DUF4345 domain-containing protein [Pseudomonadales bacterium]